MAASLSEDVAVLRAAVTALAGHDLTGLSGHEAVDLLGALTPAIDQLAAARLAVVQVVESSGVWGLDGTRSAVSWLARVERSTRGAARTDLRTARRLADHLPLTTAAIRQGAVPVVHARVMTDKCLRTQTLTALLTDPDRGEGFILDQAHLGLADFTKFLDQWCQRADPEAADRGYREAREGRGFTLAKTTGGYVPGGFLDEVTGEALTLVLQAEIGVPARDDFRTHAQRMHDALSSLTRRVLDGGTLGKHASVRPRIVVNTDYQTLQALTVTKLDTGNSTGLVGVPAATLAQSGQPLAPVLLGRLLCDSEPLPMLGQPVCHPSVGRGRGRRSRGGPGGRPSVSEAGW